MLTALQEHFFENGPFELFCQEFTAAVNEARMEQRATVTTAKRGLERIEARRKKLIELVLDDQLPASEVKGELTANAARREELTRMLESADAVPPLLHPKMAEEWRRQITELRDALAEDRSDPLARGAVRQMAEEIRPHARER